MYEVGIRFFGEGSRRICDVKVLLLLKYVLKLEWGSGIFVNIWIGGCGWGLGFLRGECGVNCKYGWGNVNVERSFG